MTAYRFLLYVKQNMYKLSNLAVLPMNFALVSVTIVSGHSQLHDKRMNNNNEVNHEPSLS